MYSKANKIIFIAIILALIILTFTIFFARKPLKNMGRNFPQKLDRASMIADLESPDVQKKCVATVNVGKEKDKKALPILIKNLNDKDSNVAILSVWAMGKIRDKRATDPLIELLENQLDDNADIIPYIAWALGEIGDEDAFKPLVELLEESPDTGHREAAIKALVKIGGPELTEILIKLFKDNDRYIRASATLSFCLSPDNNAINPLIESLLDPDKTVRINTIMALSEIGSTRALKHIRKIANNSTDSDEREKARIAIKNIETYGGRSIYQPQVDDSEYVFIESIDLSKLEDYNIEDCMGYDAMPMKVSTKKDIDALLKQLKNEDDDTRINAAWMLGNVKNKDKRIVPALADRLLHDENGPVRWYAVKSLGKLKDRRAIPAILEAVNDVDTEVREDVVQAFGRIGGKDLVEPAVKMLDDDFISVRVAAVMAVESFNDPRGNKAIVRMLEDPEPSVRRTAARSLGNLGDTSNIPALEKLLTDPNRKVRIVAGNALKKLKEKTGK